MDRAQQLKNQILQLARDYYNEVHGYKKRFGPGDRINYGGRFFDEKEICNLIDAALDFWLTAGRYSEEFEKRLKAFLGIKYCHLCNSGSSANLLAFMALTSPVLGERRILPGDEVITIAAGFPTTVSPIVQYGAVPVFTDITIPQYNIDVSRLEEVLSEKTKAVMVAHTLGNPFDLKTVRDFCSRHGLWLVEDNCDALGSMFCIDGEWKYTGTVGDIGTSSFYPPHHITTGEGGAVYTDDPVLHRIILSMRDWGRDCICPPGTDDTCGNRFGKTYGELPAGYDHKYVYSHFGYNLKITDMQAAIGAAQIEKLPIIISRRRANWEKLHNELKQAEEFFILPEPCENSLPSWFGFLLTLRDDCPFTRDEIVRYLEGRNIQTRMLFAGNLVRHPCFDEIRRDNKRCRVIGELGNTEKVMRDSFWLGVYPGLGDDEIMFMADSVKDFIKKHKAGA